MLKKQNQETKLFNTIIRLKNKEIKNTQPKSQEISNKQIPQKQRKNRKLEEKISTTKETKEKSQQRQSSRFGSQAGKDYKIFIPQPERLKKIDIQKPFSN